MTASCGPCPTMGRTSHRVSPENRDMLYGFRRRLICRSSARLPRNVWRRPSTPYRAREDQLDGESFRAAPSTTHDPRSTPHFSCWRRGGIMSPYRARRPLLRVGALLSLALLGCAPASARTGAPRAAAGMRAISQQEIDTNEARYTTAYELVRALRPGMLTARGATRAVQSA